MLRTGHLFAGAGGGILADLILGHSPAWAVEWDPYCCTILRERFPRTSVIEGDVRGVDFSRLAGVDAICAGFPCQDISCAGGGKGIAGERSGLYREVMRAVDAIRPAWVFLENSPRIRTRGRHIVVGDLVALGYSWCDGTLAASDVGAPHRRNRWWCLARRADANGLRQLQPQGGEQDQRGWAGDMGEHISNPNSLRPRQCRRLETWPDSAEPANDGSEESLADAAGQRLEEPESCEAGDEQQTAVGADRCIGWWTAEPGMGRMAHGVAHRPHRIKALGNGQVPLCAAVAWRLLGGP